MREHSTTEEITMKHRAVLAIAAVVCAGFVVQAPAQTAAPSPSASSAPVPKPECGPKPGEYPGNLASERQKTQWSKDYVAHLDCLKKFVEEEQAVLQARQKALEQAVNEYNSGVKAYNEQVQKAKGG